MDRDSHYRTLELLGETPQSFVDRYLDQIQSVVYPMVQNREVADDLVQDVFVKAWRGLPSFEGRAELSTWMCRIAMNTVYRHFEREGRTRVVCSEQDCAAASSGQSPDDAVMQIELQDKIAAAIDNLTPKLRAAIVLMAIRGIDVKCAAEIEGCSQSTMYWRLHEARQQIKNHLDDYLS